MKQFKGKAIYNPTGKAGEYSPWACNFYTGCSNDCNYCYCKRGVLSSTWSKEPKLKKYFRDKEHALEVFEKELLKNIEAIRATGLFFTFTSDPFLPETTLLTQQAARICLIHDVPVIFLSKRTDWQIDDFIREPQINGTIWNYKVKKHLFAFGFTLTGCDEEEAGASMNIERVFAMKKLHDAGFKTWASIEPVIDFSKSYAMIANTIEFCDLYKVGLQSGKSYKSKEVINFIESIGELEPSKPIYLKESIIQSSTYSRETIEQGTGNFVGSDYNLFTNK